MNTFSTMRRTKSVLSVRQAKAMDLRATLKMLLLDEVCDTYKYSGFLRRWIKTKNAKGTIIRVIFLTAVILAPQSSTSTSPSLPQFNICAKLDKSCAVIAPGDGV